MSSPWLSGSRRAPKRDFVLRTPLATAPTRPRSSVYRCRTRSASPSRIERRTTASVFSERAIGQGYIPARAGIFSRAFCVLRDMRIRVYTTRWCGYCVRAKALLDGKGLDYEEINLD